MKTLNKGYNELFEKWESTLHGIRKFRWEKVMARVDPEDDEAPYNEGEDGSIKCMQHYCVLYFCLDINAQIM